MVNSGHTFIFCPFLSLDSVLLFPSIKVVLFIKLPDFIDKQVFQDAEIFFPCPVRRVYRIIAHVHDECIVECPTGTTVQEICDLMGRVPP